MKKIVNLTQHAASREQIEEGVFDLTDNKEKLRRLLTFEELPNKKEVQRRAAEIAAIAHLALKNSKAKAAMIGGAPYLMRPLEVALEKRGIRPLYAFSKRESVEKTFPDGRVEKIQIFRHQGFV